MPSSYFDDIPVDEIDVARRMVILHEDGNVAEVLVSVLADPTASREETLAVLVIASDDPSQNIGSFLGGPNPLLVDEIFRLNHAPWLRELVNLHWENLSCRQEDYLTQVNDISVRRLAIRQQALWYFDDKYIDVDEVQTLRAQWKDLKKHEFAPVLRSVLHDPDEKSRDKIHAAIDEAQAREIDMAFYNQFATTLVLDELIRTSSLRFQKNIVDFQWLKLSPVQQNYLIELGDTPVRLLIAENWSSTLSTDQLVRLLTDEELAVRKEAYVKGISDEAKRLLSISGLVELDQGDFSLLALASDVDLDLLRGGDILVQHPATVSNHPAGSARFHDGSDDRFPVPASPDELEPVIDSLHVLLRETHLEATRSRNDL